jgi:hypothetical protein
VGLQSRLIEVWFGIIERQAIHRGMFRTVKDFTTKIRTFIDGWNDRADPFTWTKSADDILNKAKPSEHPRNATLGLGPLKGATSGIGPC